MFEKDSLTVRSTLLAGAAVLTAVTLLVAVMFLNQSRLIERAGSWVTHTYQVAEHIQDFTNLVKDATLYQRTYIVSGDAIFLTSYNAIAKPDGLLGKSVINDDLDRIQALTLDNPVQQRNVEDMRDATNDFISYLDQRIAERQANPDMVYTPGSPGLVSNALRSKALLDRIRLLGQMMLDQENQLLKQRTDENEELARHNVMLVLSGIAVFYLIKLSLSWIAYRQWKQTKLMEQKYQMRALEVASANEKLRQANNQLEKLNAQIRESGQVRLRAVVDYALDGLITLNKSGLIESFNPACERIFGYQAREVAGQPICMLMPDFHGGTDRSIRAYLAPGMAAHEATGCRKDGSSFPVELSVSEFRLEGEDHFSGILRDITTRKKVEADLLRYMRELEHSNQELDDFAYIASHDLKEPLRGLFNHASFLLEDYREKLDEEGVRRLNRLSKLTQRMETLVNDLLYFSRLGRSELAIQSTDPNQVIRDIGQMMESSLKEKNAKIVIPNAMPVMTCDKPRMTEVFRNLITNAVKYNDKPERLIEVGFLDAANAPHGREKNVFYVRDNGIGIDPEFHTEIFRIFKRLNRDDGQESGTGVGLTFVKKIVERHKGHVWLESVRGQGTTFFFNINQEQNHAEERAMHSAGGR